MVPAGHPVFSGEYALGSDLTIQSLNLFWTWLKVFDALCGDLDNFKVCGPNYSFALDEFTEVQTQFSKWFYQFHWNHEPSSQKLVVCKLELSLHVVNNFMIWHPYS